MTRSRSPTRTSTTTTTAQGVYESGAGTSRVDYALFADKAAAETARRRWPRARASRTSRQGRDRRQLAPRAVHRDEGPDRQGVRDRRRSASRRTSSRRSCRWTRRTRPRSNLTASASRLLLRHPADRRRREGRSAAVVRLGQGPDRVAAALDAAAVARAGVVRKLEAAQKKRPSTPPATRRRRRRPRLPRPRHGCRMATLVALGPGDPDLIPLASWRVARGRRPGGGARTTSRSPTGWASTASRSTPSAPVAAASASGCRRLLAERLGGRVPGPALDATCSSPTPWSGCSA